MSVAPVSREYDSIGPMTLLLIMVGCAFLDFIKQTAQLVDRYVFFFDERRHYSEVGVFEITRYYRFQRFHSHVGCTDCGIILVCLAK